MAATKLVDPARVIVTYAGALLAGFAEGSKLTITTNTQFESVVGSDGWVTRVKKNNKTATVTVRLQQSSVSNDILTALFQADINSPGGLTNPLFIKDMNGTSLFSVENAWITKLPDQEFGSDVTAREWEFATGDANINVGGN